VELDGDALDVWHGVPDVLAREQRLRVAATWLAVGADERLVEALPARPVGAFFLFED
jgi:hypothetical protein